MKDFKSRFKTFIHFEDYNAAELTQIFCKLAKDYELKITEGALRRVTNICHQMLAAADETFGNARDVRNLFEDVFKGNYAARVAAGDRNLSQIIEDDIPDHIINRSPHSPASPHARSAARPDKPPPGVGA